MNVIKLYGGLGNQLFQYALGKAQDANGIDVCFETTWFLKEENKYRPYTLDKFKTTVPIGSFKKQPTLNEISLKYMDDLLFTRIDNHNFFGYWQHPRYFTAVLPQLKKEFVVREEFYTEEYLTLKKKILSENSIALHVRRGDYVQINGHHLLPLEYYTKALELVTGDVYVFSDDIPWCKEHFEDVIFVDIEEYLSFELMRLCKSHIIANSTFSWWAAYLSGDNNVIAPVQWRKDKYGQSFVSKDILSPAGWQLISLETDWNGK